MNKKYLWLIIFSVIYLVCLPLVETFTTFGIIDAFVVYCFIIAFCMYNINKDKA